MNAAVGESGFANSNIGITLENIEKKNEKNYNKN